MADTEQYPPPPVVALAAWLVPGGGYWLIRQRTRALTVGITVIMIFLLGIFLAGIRVVEAPSMAGAGNPLTKILQKPWFLGQVLAGPLGVVSAYISASLAASPQYAKIVSHARLAEMGTLYTAVAGMLNLLAIIDAAFRSANQGRR